MVLERLELVLGLCSTTRQGASLWQNGSRAPVSGRPAAEAQGNAASLILSPGRRFSSRPNMNPSVSTSESASDDSTTAAAVQDSGDSNLFVRRPSPRNGSTTSKGISLRQGGCGGARKGTRLWPNGSGSARKGGVSLSNLHGESLFCNCKPTTRKIPTRCPACS